MITVNVKNVIVFSTYSRGAVFTFRLIYVSRLNFQSLS
jgi:hypothetical protein